MIAKVAASKFKWECLPKNVKQLRSVPRAGLGLLVEEVDFARAVRHAGPAVHDLFLGVGPAQAQWRIRHLITSNICH